MPYQFILAETSPTVQKIVQLVFPEPEFEVRVFEDGQELLNALPGLRPDAFLIALALPGKDGYEVGRYLHGREEFRRVPLAFLRGTFEPLDQERLLGIDHRGVIRRPFSSDKLGAFFRELIDGAASPPTLPEEPVFEEPAPAVRPGRSAAPPETWAEPEPAAAETASAGAFVAGFDPFREAPPGGGSRTPTSSAFEDGGFAEPGGGAARPSGDLRREMLEAEREIEKRVRARVLAEVREYVESRLQSWKDRP